MRHGLMRLLLALAFVAAPAYSQIANVRASAPVFETGAGSDVIVAEVSDLSTVAGGTLLVVTVGEDGTAGVVASLSGFTEMCSTGSNRFKVWAKDAAANESDVSVTFAGTTAVKAVFAITWEGGRTVSDLMENGNACFVSSVTGANLTYPSADITNAGALIGIGVKRFLQWTSVAQIGSFTNELIDASTALGSDLSVTAEYDLTPADVTGSTKAVTGDASQVNYYLMMPILEAVSFSCPMDTQCVTLTSIGMGSDVEAFNVDATPDAAADDILVCPETVTQASSTVADVTATADGFLGYDNGDDSRAVFECDLWDDSAGDYHADKLRFVANDPAISCDAPFDVVWPIDQAITSIDMSTLCAHPLGDALTFTSTGDAEPTGTTFSDPTLSGTPTVEDEAGADLEYTPANIYGGTATQEITAYPLDDRTVPDGVGDDITTFDAELLAEWLYLGNITAECSTETPGTIISQDPAASATAAPKSEVDVVVARRCPRNGRGINNGSIRIGL